MAGLRTGEVAAAAGVNLQTLRYYERRGLLAEPKRTLGGHRVYPEQTVTVLRVIKAAQRLGFTLEEVGELLDSRRHHHGQPPDTGLHERATVKLAEVEARIADLQVIATTLRAELGQARRLTRPAHCHRPVRTLHNVKGPPARPNRRGVPSPARLSALATS
jgi:MerR family mercuric resistance operon transcriptional regulator